MDSGAATLLSVGFDLGLYDRGTVRDWVDREIEAAEQLEGPLLELATISHRSDDDVAGLLRALARPAPEGFEARVEIGMIGRMVEAGEMTLKAGVRRLSGMAYGAGLTGEEQDCIFEIVDGYDLAVAGTYGSLAEVRASFEELTSRHRSLVAWDPTRAHDATE